MLIRYPSKKIITPEWLRAQSCLEKSPAARRVITVGVSWKAK